MERRGLIERGAKKRIYSINAYSYSAVFLRNRDDGAYPRVRLGVRDLFNDVISYKLMNRLLDLLSYMIWNAPLCLRSRLSCFNNV